MSNGSEKFNFKNVRHIKRLNFAPDGSLLSKEKVKTNIERHMKSMNDKRKKDELVIQKEIPDLTNGFTTIMCYAGWCGHCRTAKPVFDNICQASKCMNVQLCAIDCANDKDNLVEVLNGVLHNKFKHTRPVDKLIIGFPTFIQFKDGVFYRRYEGLSQDSEELLKFIIGLDKYINK